MGHMGLWNEITERFEDAKEAMETDRTADMNDLEDEILETGPESDILQEPDMSESEITQRLQQVDEYEFEIFVAELWERRGWDTEITEKSRDKGIDVIASRSVPYQEKEIIQAKRYQVGNRVSSRDIQQYASLRQQVDGADKVVVVCTSGFTDDALNIAKDVNVKCVDGRTLAQIVTEEQAQDLVRKYSDSPSERVQAVPPRKQASVRSSEKSFEKQDSPTTLVEQGEFLSVELVGFEDVTTKIPSPGIGFSSDSELDGVMVALKLYNHSEHELAFREPDDFVFIDENSRSYSPANLGKGSFKGGWQKHGGSYDSIDPVFVQPGGTMKYIVGVSVPNHIKISTIKSNVDDVTINLDYKTRSELPSLPEEVRSEL